MDYETKIYLEKLIGAVDSPDWWSISITAVNALIVVGLTIWQLCLNRKQTKIQERQNDLQQQQLKLQEQQNNLQEHQIRVQEYDIYRKMFSVVKKSDEITNNLLNIIYNYFSCPLIKQLDKNVLNAINNDVNKLKNRLKECSTDFELKFSKKYVTLNYEELLNSTNEILQLFINMDESGTIILKEDKNNSNAVLISHRTKKQDVIVDAIIDRIIDEKLKVSIRQILTSYIQHCKGIQEMDVANDIKKYIKPIDA